MGWPLPNRIYRPPYDAPFHEGYLAGVIGAEAGAAGSCATRCPYPRDSLAAEVWTEGLAAWTLDVCAGMVSRSRL